MSQQLERLLPVLAAIPGVNIPAAFLQSAYIAASQKKIEQLEQALRYEIGLLNQKIAAGQLHLDHDYVRSDAFAANVMQALRAAEIAESKDKLNLIAQAVAGCTLTSNSNKSILMRIMEGVTIEEIQVLISVRKKMIDNGGIGSVEHDDLGLPIETLEIFQGLFQLGLLSNNPINISDDVTGQLVLKYHWRLSILAERFVELCTATTQP